MEQLSLHLDYDKVKKMYFFIMENSEHKITVDIARRDIHPILETFRKTVARIERDFPE